MDCSKTNNGFNNTSLNDVAKDFIKQMNYGELKLARDRYYTKNLHILDMYVPHVVLSLDQLNLFMFYVLIVMYDFNIQKLVLSKANNL